MSAGARDEVLARVRSALATPGTHHPRADGPPATGAGLAVPTHRAEILDLFAERVEDYRAVVDRVSQGDLAAAVARALDAHGATSAVTPAGLDPAWLGSARSGGVTVSTQHEVTRAGRPDAAALDEIVGVVTTATVAIAVTGTIVLDHGPGQGPRALTLVPDLHVCVVRAEQVVADVPEATAQLADSVRAGRPLTWISGPSATSDIELERVEGVHGPRTLHVLLVDPSRRPTARRPPRAAPRSDRVDPDAEPGESGGVTAVLAGAVLAGARVARAPLGAVVARAGGLGVAAGWHDRHLGTHERLLQSEPGFVAWAS